jgi:hypothetical protein
MAAKKVDINIKTTADTTGAKQTTAAVESLTTATNKSATAADTVTTSTTKMGKAASVTGGQVQSMTNSIDLGDSAAAQFGEALLTVAGNMGILGTALAVGVGLGKKLGEAFYDLWHQSEDLTDKIGDMSGKLKEAFADDAKNAVDRYNDALGRTKDRADAVRTAEATLAENRNLQAETNAKLIESNLSLEIASVKYLKTIGLVVDEEKALQALRDQAAAATTAAAIAAQQAKIENENKKLQSLKEQKSQIEFEAVLAQASLAKLEAKQQEVFAELNRNRARDASAIRSGDQGEGFKSLETQTSEADKEKVAAQIANIYRIINSTPDRIEKINNALVVAEAERDTNVQQIEATISEITQKADLSKRTQDLTAAANQITTDAKEITEQIAKVDAITPLQQQAKAEIAQMAADGQITAQDQIKISQNLNFLLNSLKTGQTESLSTVRSLIDVNNQMALKMNAMSKEIKGLQVRIQNIK